MLAAYFFEWNNTKHEKLLAEASWFPIRPNGMDHVFVIGEDVQFDYQKEPEGLRTGTNHRLEA
jgi:hypothetical protein